MTVFLTGGNGGIGSIIQEALKKANIEVIAPTSQELNLSKEIDVSVYPEINGFIHCAGINNLAHHTDIKTNELNNLLSVNTISFVELCKKLKLKPNSNIIAIGSLYSLFT